MDAHATDSPSPWIDPYCPLLGDHRAWLSGTVDERTSDAESSRAVGLADEPATHAADGRPVADAVRHKRMQLLATTQRSMATASVNGKTATLSDAIGAAAQLLSGWKQPLIAGLGTDIAGGRALTRLGLRCGAILDHAHGDTLTQALRAQQDRGGFTTTLAEIHERADLIIFLGVDPMQTVPDFFARCGLRASTAFGDARRVLFVHAKSTDPQDEVLALQGDDLHSTLAELNAAIGGRALPRGSIDWPMLQTLAADLRRARYAVLVYAPSTLPGRHAALLIESISRLVKSLNAHTRAATLALGSANGAASTQQVATWLTGLPLRTGLHPHGFEHDPHRYGTARLLADHAVDGLLWVSSFDPDLPYPLASDAALPAIVFGHPALADKLPPGTGPRVFIPVASPGVNARGHLFRSDTGVVLPLAPLFDTALPGVAEVSGQLHAALDRLARELPGSRRAETWVASASMHNTGNTLINGDHSQ
jgi:formylmethanofuran dehydrogenase subunit B